MDGVLIDLLNAKWNTFVKFKFYKQFFTFSFYFIISLIAFTLRPGPPPSKDFAHSNTTNTTNTSLLHHHTPENMKNLTRIINSTIKWENLTSKPMFKKSDDENNDVEEWWGNLQKECRLMQLTEAQDTKF